MEETDEMAMSIAPVWACTNLRLFKICTVLYTAIRPVRLDVNHNTKFVEL